MVKLKATTKSKLKASQKPQARRSGGNPKKGRGNQKRPASDGSDGAESSEVNPGPRARPRKKTRHFDVDSMENENVEGEDNEEEVEEAGDEDEVGSAGIEQVSSLYIILC
jgi:hypothetical protein